MSFEDAIKIFGPSGGLLLFALITGAFNKWHFDGSVQALLKAKDEAHKEAVEERDEQITKLEERNKRLEALVFEALDRGERLAVLAEAPPALPAPPRRRRPES